MCISAAVIAAASLAVAAVGTAATIDNANYQAKMTEFQLADQRKALRQQQEQARIAGMEAEAARLDEFNRARAANLAALAATGTGQNMSYLQGVEKSEEQALNFDLRNIRIGNLGEQNRITQDIRVNRFDSLINRANRQSAVVGAGINFAKSVVSIGQTYNDSR